MQWRPFIPAFKRQDTTSRSKSANTSFDHAQFIHYLRNLDVGGRWQPSSDCASTTRLAVVVPHRDRAFHLRVLLYNLHRLLQAQRVEYGIYVIEQVKISAFPIKVNVFVLS